MNSEYGSSSSTHVRANTADPAGPWRVPRSNQSRNIKGAQAKSSHAADVENVQKTNRELNESSIEN
jgi:hypothetical protein